MNNLFDGFKLERRLRSFNNDELMDIFFSEPNALLGERTPQEVWDSGDHKLVFKTIDRYSDKLKLVSILTETFASESIELWLSSPSHYLKELTPREVWNSGDHDKVFAALEALRDGVYI